MVAQHVEERGVRLDVLEPVQQQHGLADAAPDDLEFYVADQQVARGWQRGRVGH